VLLMTAAFLVKAPVVSAQGRLDPRNMRHARD